MRRPPVPARLGWLVALALGAGACRQGPPARGTPPDTAALVAVVDSFEAAFAAEDSARIGRVVSADSSFIFFGTGGAEIEASRQVFLAKHEEQDWAQLDSISFGPREHLRVQASPDLAVVMYQTTLHFVAAGERGVLPVRLALTLANESGTWRIRQGLAAQVAP